MPAGIKTCRSLAAAATAVASERPMSGSRKRRRGGAFIGGVVCAFVSTEKAERGDSASYRSEDSREVGRSRIRTEGLPGYG